jgi:hypothetical protein
MKIAKPGALIRPTGSSIAAKVDPKRQTAGFGEIFGTAAMLNPCAQE